MSVHQFTIWQLVLLDLFLSWGKVCEFVFHSLQWLLVNFWGWHSGRKCCSRLLLPLGVHWVDFWFLDLLLATIDHVGVTKLCQGSAWFDSYYRLTLWQPMLRGSPRTFIVSTRTCACFILLLSSLWGLLVVGWLLFYLVVENETEPGCSCRLVSFIETDFKYDTTRCLGTSGICRAKASSF